MSLMTFSSIDLYPCLLAIDAGSSLRSVVGIHLWLWIVKKSALMGPDSSVDDKLASAIFCGLVEISEDVGLKVRRNLRSAEKSLNKLGDEGQGNSLIVIDF
jgi:hypothetical protein